MNSALARLVVTAGLLLAAGPAAAGGNVTDPAAAVNAFGVDLHRRLADEGGNVFFSPASVAYALVMTRTGAAGPTAAEMDRVLRLAPDDPQLSAAFGRLMDRLSADREFAELRIANRLYGQQGFPFRPTFLADLAHDFGAGLEQVDFRNDAEAARLLINGWVEEQTNERIKDLLQPGMLDRASTLVLVNALYFLGTWQKPFPVEATAEAPFHRADGSDVVAPFMHVTGRFGHAHEGGAQVLSLPYKGGELDMVIILPDEGASLRELERRLDGNRLAAWLAAPAPQEVAVTLPKLHLETSFELGRTLAAMGMPTAFSGHADFSGMVEGGGLAIGSVVHKAFLDVDEKGTEAAAATAVEMRLTSIQPRPPVPFVADRPFLLAIRHAGTGALLFFGRVADPS